MTLLIFLALFTGCWSDTHELKVTSNYDGNIDSLVLNVNFKTVSKLENIRLGLDTTLIFSTNDVSTRHDVLVSAVLYNQGRKIDSIFSFNDLGYVPKRTTIHINDSLRLKFGSIP